jgi:hypothetical protein
MNLNEDSGGEVASPSLGVSRQITSIVRQPTYYFKEPKGLAARVNNGFNIARKNVLRIATASADTFHYVIEMPYHHVILILCVSYVVVVLFFAIWWYVLSQHNKGTNCSVGIENFTDAYYFSLITLTTIGYGASSTFFESCAEPSIIITCESLCGLVMSSLFVGTFYSKASRGSNRALTIAFSKKAIIRTINGQRHFMFRVVETRQQQICEAHVRVYAIFDKVDERGVMRHFETQLCRLTHPDDELGAMLLLMLPQVVVHGIDNWSPLMPVSHSRRNRRDAMRNYAFPEVVQRGSDVLNGNRTAVVCGITGESFQTEWAHRLHHLREDVDCYHSSNGKRASARTDVELSSEDSDEKLTVKGPDFPPEIEVATDEDLINHFRQSNLEILVIVEGVEPTLSSTIQSYYNYTVEDIVFEHDFAPCTFRKRKGSCVIDYKKFHDTFPLASGSIRDMISPTEQTLDMSEHSFRTEEVANRV